MKRLLTILCFLPIVHSNAQQLVTPTVSLQSGIYTLDQTVSITHPEPGVTLFYTLNGSDPTPLDPIYTGSLNMSGRTGDPDNYALVGTNPSFLYPVGDYTEQRANNRGWLAPYVNEIYKVNVLRVKAYKAGFVPSETASRTYIIDPLGGSLYSMPIVSFVIDSTDLFSAATGIYKFGDHPMGNYSQKGVEWERTAYMEYFDENGILAFQRNVRTRIHGGGSRQSTKKTFRIYAEYDGFSNFKYEFFEGYNQNTFKRILLRTGGHRPDCFPRDNLSNAITSGLKVDQQHFRHVIVFINGEYWGIHSIKERVDKYFFQNHYGIDDDEITVLDQEYDVQDGYGIDSLEMVKIESRADTSDMSDPLNYQWIKDRIDIENYIDYMAGEIFLSNEDWVYSNVVLWRKTGAYVPGAGPGKDGKFRWANYDFDGAFGGSCANAYYTVNTLANATVSTGLYAPYTRLFRGLLSSDEFKRSWINRTCDLMNSHFKSSVLQSKLDSFYAELTPEMLEEVERWHYPSEATTLLDRQSEVPSLVQWDTSFYYLNRFADRRQRKIREHILAKWSYPDTSKITVDVNDASMGMVQVNTILLNDALPGVNSVVYPWVGLYIDSVESELIAIPLPGYEFVEWIETGETNDTIKWLPSGDTVYTALFQLSSGYQSILINEVMPSNSSFLQDDFGDFDDWLELFNPNNYAVNLSNCSIERNGTTWYLPQGSSIDANGYLLFWCDNEDYQGEKHTNFKLPNLFTTITLYDPSNVVMDDISYPQTTSDESYGRFPNGSSSFGFFTSPTPNFNNDNSSVEHLDAIQSLIGFPNPTNGTFMLNKKVSFQLFGLDGKLLMNGSNTNSIDLSHLQNGTYILKTIEGESLKIVVRK
jgi:CotH kinase protein/Lamin Tail Domain/Secretion system C-terminal sorting domain/Chitobiase/beta-hexosaminidase C-terminal domain